MAFSIQSRSFEDGGRIPTKYTHDGSNISPSIEWRDVPAGARSFAVVVEDPDAPRGVFRHWAAYDIGPQHEKLPEDAGRSIASAGFKMAKNDFGERQYDGPQPPKGHGTHHYHFRCAALSVDHLDVPENATALDVWKAAQAHSIVQAEFVGTYAR